MTGNERIRRLYNQYVNNWYKEHSEGFPCGFNEWYVNEYNLGYTTEHNRTGKNKRTGEFYTKEFISGKIKISRADLEELPVSMDTYDLDDTIMQLIAESTDTDMKAEYGKDYELKSIDDYNKMYRILEGVAYSLGVNYYEDYDEEIEE